MTRAEYERLNELDNIIAWNNSEDGGRDLTEEELKEHGKLMARILSGEKVEE